VRGERPEAPEPLPHPVVDNHCHLDIDAGAGVLPVGEALARAAAVGVPRIVQIGCDLPGARWAVETATAYDAVVAGVALHPNEVPRLAAQGALDGALAEIEQLARSEPVRAVGETGLDYFRTGEDGRGLQHDAFRWHVDLARRLDRTLVIHDRDAHDDVLRVLRDEGAPEAVVFHSFSGDAEMARECAAAGWVLSFSGVVTFRNAPQLRAAAAAVDPGQVLVETDAPFLTPHPHRGTPNAPRLLPLTLAGLAAAQGGDPAELAAATAETGRRIFGW
jgi:TatD DNase family protein